MACYLHLTVCYLHLLTEGRIHTIFRFLLRKLFFSSLSQNRAIRNTPGWGSNPELRATRPERQRYHCVIPQGRGKCRDARPRAGLQLPTEGAFVHGWLSAQPRQSQQGPIPAALGDRMGAGKKRPGCSQPLGIAASHRQGLHAEGPRL